MAEMNQPEEQKPKTEKKPKADRKKRKKRKKMIILAVVLALAGAGGFFGYRKMKEAETASAKAQEQKTAVAERRNITSELSSSGTLEPKDTYTITSLVEGDVVAADFEEGDQVEKGQILYQIDATSMESEIQSANNSLVRAQNTYQDAVEDYQEIQAKLSGNNYKATKSGYIKELYIEAGDKVSGNTKICDLYDDLTMKIRLPFLSGEAAVIAPGAEAVLTLSDTGEQLSGIVSSVGDMEEVLNGGALVRYVTIEVGNPGGLTTQTAATAVIGDCLAAEEGYFEAIVDSVMSADLDSSVEVEALLVSKGSYVTKGTPLFQITAKSVQDVMKSYEDSIDKAEESVETARNKVDSTQDSFENYTITAPISGQVITKTTKEGDKITKSSNGSTTMAVIYDLSALTFQMSIDELDIQNVRVGQKVEVTADAFEGRTFTGTVTNVSLESTASNGVTNYPVTVTMDEVGSLLPGMNVDGVIILDEVENVLAIPVDSLMRGNLVYVKDDSGDAAAGKPGTEGGSSGDSSAAASAKNVPEGFHAVEVETGLTSDDYVEIISGLQEGQEVYVSESTKNTYTNFMPGGGMPGGYGGPGGGGPGGGNRGGGMH